MDKKQFADRLASLRMKKGTSAREMSLALGQSPGYINNIENGVNLPSMTVFFYICEYLNISPKDFFDVEVDDPEKLDALLGELKKLDAEQLEMISALVRGLIGKK